MDAIEMNRLDESEAQDQEEQEQQDSEAQDREDETNVDDNRINESIVVIDTSNPGARPLGRNKPSIWDTDTLPNPRKDLGAIRRAYAEDKKSPQRIRY